jgi:hypothetical protein
LSPFSFGSGTGAFYVYPTGGASALPLTAFPHSIFRNPQKIESEERLMKNYQDSDYALNKLNRNAIIYKFTDGIVEITLEVYLRDNPGKNESDFYELKALSDLMYYEQDREEYRQTYKNISLYGLDETDACAVPSPEESVIEQPERAARKKRRREIAEQALVTLTFVQQRRYVMYHVKGMTEDKIAQTEGSTQQAVSKSLMWADKKIKKFLQQQKNRL